MSSSSSPSSAEPQSDPNMSEMLSNLLESEKVDTRAWWRTEYPQYYTADLDRLVDPMLESLFHRLGDKLAKQERDRSAQSEGISLSASGGASADDDRILTMVDHVFQTESIPKIEYSQPLPQISSSTSLSSSCFKPVSTQISSGVDELQSDEKASTQSVHLFPITFMKHNINSLPDLVIRLIFSKLPLADLLTAGRVCPLWKSYQMELIAKVDSLTLLIGAPGTESLITNSYFTDKYRDLLRNDDGTRAYAPQHLPTHFHLKYEPLYDLLSLDRAAELVDILPHITTLEIAVNVLVNERFVASEFQINPTVHSLVRLYDIVDEDFIGPIMYLLTKWSPILKSLKLFLQIAFDPETDTVEYVKVLNVINSMPLLEHLTVDFVDSEVDYFNYEGPVQIDPPNLDQLRELNFKAVEMGDFVDFSLEFFESKKKNLTKICFESGISNSFPTLGYVNDHFPLLAKNISSISLGDDPQALADFLPRFISLTHLKVNKPTTNKGLFDGALNGASSFSSLSHLHLNTEMDFFRVPTEEESLAQLSPLCSVKVLTISVTSATPAFESDHWAYLFPNVQVIELRLKIYGQIMSIRKIEDLYRSKEELGQIVSPFAQCPKLRHLYTLEKHFSYDEDDTYQYRAYEDNYFWAQELTEWTVLKVGDQKVIVKVQK